MDNVDKSVKGEMALWQGVITQALMDARTGVNKVEAQFQRAEARAWLRRRTPDFDAVCDLAGLDPDYTIEECQKALKRNCEWRTKKNAFGTGSKASARRESSGVRHAGTGAKGRVAKHRNSGSTSGN